MNSHWAVTTSSGRRVSLLCDERIDCTTSYASSAGASPTPPPSPGCHRPYAPIRADSISSACSSTSSLSTVSSQGYYSPRTPPNAGLNLPAFEKLMPLPSDNVFLARKYTPEISSSVIAPALLAESPTAAPEPSPKAKPARPAATRTNTTASSSSGAPPAAKRSSRRYTCHCNKSFTTSGHLARHTRIHTGEKNYVCPEPNCGARFSRQDNCMQHYRTHSSTAGSKRSSRKQRRLSTDSSASTCTTATSTTDVSPREAPRAPSMTEHHYAPQPLRFVEEAGGLAALAIVACEAST
jgi:uncharacterized Zn-finger protein